MTNGRPFLYGLKDIDQYQSLHHIREKNKITLLCHEFFGALNKRDYQNPIFQEAYPEEISAKIVSQGIKVIDGLPKCDGLRRGLPDILASHYILIKNFPKFVINSDEVLVFVDDKFHLADVMIMFSTENLPVGRNGEGGVCVLRWIKVVKTGEWVVIDGMHMQGSNGF